MYTGIGKTRITGGSLTPFEYAPASIENTFKEKLDSYVDVNNNRRANFLGYEIEFNLKFVFKKSQKASQTLLRKLINIRNVVLTPHTDKNESYQGILSLNKDKQGFAYDTFEVKFTVNNLQQNIPEQIDSPVPES